MNRTLSRNLATWLNIFLVVTLLVSLLLPVHLVSASSSRSNSVTSALSLQINPPELEVNPVATIDPTMNVKAVDMGEEELYSAFSPLSVVRNKSHFSPPLSDDPLPSQKLTADDGVAEDWFGDGAAVSENYAVVGAPGDDDQGGNAGSAYIFKRNAENGFWSQASKLYGSNTDSSDEFGSSVAISGDHMIIGAPKVYIQYPIEGAVYFFKRNPETDTWVQIDQEVTDGGSYSYFGRSVAISGDYAIVGTQNYGAYLFNYDGASWSQVGDARLTTIGGTSVAISGDYAIVGAPNAGSGGTAYIFHNDGGSWTQVGNPLAGSNTNGGDGFGQSVAISGDYALIGAPYAEPEATYVFKRNPDTGNWEEVDILTASDGSSTDYFGHSVAISGESGIVGAENRDVAYIFGRNPNIGDWDQQHILTDTNSTVSYFGRSVGISGEHAIVGAYNDSELGSSAGAAYIFQIGGSGLLTYSISGTVTWTASGNPISGVTVEAQQGGVVIGSGTTDSEGVYEITGLAAGSYELTASIDDPGGLLTFVSSTTGEPTIQVSLSGDVSDQDFVAEIEDPTTALGFKGANWLNFEDTTYEDNNVGWNLERSSHFPQVTDVDDLFGQQSVQTIVRLDVDNPRNWVTGPILDQECSDFARWIAVADHVYETVQRNSTPIFILNNEPNLHNEWGLTAAEYAHVYNCYYQHWRVEKNYPHWLFVAGPGDDNGGYAQFYQDLLNDGDETINFADGFAIHAYGYYSADNNGNSDIREDPDPNSGLENNAFRDWLYNWRVAIDRRNDLEDRPIFITEYNPGAQDNWVNVLPDPDDPEDWFNRTYCWVQYENGLGIYQVRGLLYFVDEAVPERRDGVDSDDWFAVSLENNGDWRQAWLEAPSNGPTTCNSIPGLTHNFDIDMPGREYLVIPASFSIKGKESKFDESPGARPGFQTQNLSTTGFISGPISGELGVGGYENVFYVTNDLEIPVGQTLTIAQGTTLVFAEGLRMEVAGQLIAEGNTLFPVRFVGLNGAGWRGLHIQTTSQGSRCQGCYLENIETGETALAVDAPISFRDSQIWDSVGSTAITTTVPFTLSNVVIDNVGTGLDFSGAGSTIHSISHLTLTRCQQGIVTLNQTLAIANSIITTCDVAISTGVSGTTTISYTLLYGNNQDYMTDLTGQLNQGPGLLNADPGFVDFPTTYRLRPDSPAVDAGDPQADYSRELGYNGDRADLGAYGNTWQAPQNPPLSQMAISLNAPISEQSGSTGQTVTYTLTLKNSGSVVDYYTVSIADSRFPAKMDEGGFEGPRQFFLTPQEEVTMTIWVEIPLFTSNFTNTTAIRVSNGYGIEAQVELTTSVEASFQEAGGQAVVEGEHFNHQIERNGQRWLIQDSLTDYVGSGYAAALPDIDTLFGADYTTASRELRYSLNLTTTGVYTAWLRGYAPNGAGDSLHIALDNQPAAILTGFAPERWSWANQNSQGGTVTIEVTEAGLHTLRLWQREDGLRVDRILLTTDSGYIPTGDGPPESSIR